MKYPSEKGTHSGCIMILGAANDNKGNLSLIAKLRLTQGAKELSLHPDYKILLTGGFGNHFNETKKPHWQYAKAFLINELSVSPAAFLPEAIESANTVEDIEKARLILRKYHFSKIIIVTSEFHVARVRYIAEKALPMNAATLVYACAADEALDKDLMHRLREHEQRAIDYLQLHYPR